MQKLPLASCASPVHCPDPAASACTGYSLTAVVAFQYEALEEHRVGIQYTKMLRRDGREMTWWSGRNIRVSNSEVNK